MAFQPGQSGNPGGRSTEKPWRDALIRAIKRREPLDPASKPQNIDLLAEAMVKRAIADDTPAAREIGDRLDGKAIQQIEADVQTNNVSEIRMVPVAPVTE
jgi:hypothetical protein